MAFDSAPRPGAPPPMLPLRVNELCFGLNGHALLKQISLQIEAGGPTVILGPNGAGKTLLLKLCHGLLQPSSGTLRWASATPLATRRRQALMFQRPVLLRRTVAENIEYVLQLQGYPRRSQALRVLELLAQTGLEALASRPARVLSGGEQQRLALARLWALTPEVMLLDEPTANLDPSATRAIELLIREISAAGTKIILSTHDLTQAQRLASDVVFLHRGRLIERSTADKFFATPATAEAAAFIRGELLWH